MFIKPSFDRILAKKIEEENKTITGIELKESTTVKKAIVIDIAKKIEENEEISVGDTIYYEPYTVLDLEKNNLILVKYIDVLGYEKKKKKEEN